MAIAGEEVRGVTTPPAWPVKVMAVVALSPYADFSGVALGRRYGRIAGPVLSVTGNNDVDATGLVGSASIRRAPYEYMPAGDKYLLSLTDLPHGGFAGASSGQEAEGGRPSEAVQAPSADQGSRSSGGGASSGRHRRGGGQAESGPRVGAGGWEGGSGLSATGQALDQAVIQSVTTAFLDAYVKNDAIAREWLEKDAARWARNSAEVQRK